MAIVEQAEEGDGRAASGTRRGRPGETASEPWPLPARFVDCLSLDSRSATLAYWGSVALIVTGFFVTELLPCVDYPQHLALSDVARRLADPAAPEHAIYQLNYFTYNGLFHILVAKLSAFLPIELAGRLTVGASLVATAGAVVALVRILQRPAIHAALFLPVLFSFSLGWGFVNYVLATAIALWTLVFVVRCAVRPTWTRAAAVAALGLLCAFAHVLAMLILCLSAAGLGAEAAWRSEPPGPAPGRRWLSIALRASAAVGPLLLGCAYCLAVYKQQYPWDPHMYRDPTMEGSAPPVWDKIIFFGAFATDLYRDGSDQVVLWITVGIMGWSAILAWKRRRAWDRPREATPPFVAPFVLLLGAYFATPMVLVGTHLIFPRLSQWAVLGGLLAMPQILESSRAHRARAWIARLAVLTGVSALVHCVLFACETRDASRLIDDMPPGGAATAVIWEPGTWAFRNGALTHLAAYYAARKHGRWAFAFARYLSVPVRFQPNSQPAWPAQGWEFDADQYDARCKYARAFPLVLVKAPIELSGGADSESLVRELLFSADVACGARAWERSREVKVLSHHGRFWGFDTTGLPDDGTF